MNLPHRKVRVQLSVRMIGDILIAFTRLNAFERDAKMTPTALNGSILEQLSIPLTDEEFDVIQGHFKDEAEKVNEQITLMKSN